jgi:steroid 5-alpha reductase family enzyme
MTFLIVKISGADLLEKSLVKTRPGYQDYMAQTNRFIPKLF